MDVANKRAYEYASAFQSCGAVPFSEREREVKREGKKEKERQTERNAV